MGSTLDFVTYVCEQIAGVGILRYRKMFGEYMVYADEKAVMLVCDNICYVKIHPAITHLLTDAEIGTPYDGAKPHYILPIENSNLSRNVIKILAEVLPYPKKKRSSE